MTRIAIPCIAIPPEDAERLDAIAHKYRGTINEVVMREALGDAYTLAASRPRSDYATHLETALSEIDVPRIGAVREGGEWRVTLTTSDGNSRDGAGANFIEALLEATLAVCAMRAAEAATHEDGAALLASKAGR